MKLLLMYPDLQAAKTCCVSICSLEYPLFLNLGLSAGLLTTLSAYKHLCACILACEDIVTVCSQTWFCIISSMALMLQLEDSLFDTVSESMSNKAQLDESWLGA